MAGLHIVLGGGGAIGGAVVRELQAREEQLIAVEHEHSLLQTETRIADARDPEALLRATEGASHIYQCIGLPYDSARWQRDWPRIAENVVLACSTHGAKLLYFDNAYMYGPPPLSVPVTEAHRQAPSSRKGAARKCAADIVTRALEAGKVSGTIARSAEFYGPYARNSSLYISFLERMLAGKAPLLLSSSDVPHTFAYTEDCARAMVELALCPDACDGVFHLPTSGSITFREVCTKFNRELGTSYEINTLPPSVRRLLSLFVPLIREASEMLYQFDTEYELSWERFHTRFPDFTPTSYEEGIRAMAASFGRSDCTHEAV